jgi:hypothetical protein
VKCECTNPIRPDVKRSPSARSLGRDRGRFQRGSALDLLTAGADGFHPSSAGYAILAAALAPTVRTTASVALGETDGIVHLGPDTSEVMLSAENASRVHHPDRSEGAAPPLDVLPPARGKDARDE